MSLCSLKGLENNIYSCESPGKSVQTCLRHVQADLFVKQQKHVLMLTWSPIHKSKTYSPPLYVLLFLLMKALHKSYMAKANIINTSIYTLGLGTQTSVIIVLVIYYYTIYESLNQLLFLFFQFSINFFKYIYLSFSHFKINLVLRQHF